MSLLSITSIFLFSFFCLYLPQAGLANELLPTSQISAADNGKNRSKHLSETSNKHNYVGHLKEILLFAVSQDGRICVTGDADENNFIWDLKSGELIKKIGKPDKVRIRVVAAAYSPESTQLLWARDFKIMPVLWDVESGRRLAVFSSKDNGHTAPVIAVTFSPDGRYVATGDRDGTVVIWNRAVRTVVRRFKAHSGEARFLVFIPDRNELATAGSDGAVRLWSVSSGSTPPITLLERSHGAVTALARSADGLNIYAALDDMTVKGWAISTRSIRTTLNFNNRQINSIALSPDGDFMAVAEEDESVLLWNIRESKIEWEKRLDSSATKVVFSPNGKHLYTSGGDSWIRDWDVATGLQLKKFGGVKD